MATLGHQVLSLRMRQDGARLVLASLPKQEPQDKLPCLSTDLGFLKKKGRARSLSRVLRGMWWEQGKVQGTPAASRSSCPAQEAAVMLGQLRLGHVKG